MFSVLILPVTEVEKPPHSSNYSSYLEALKFGEKVIGAADVSSIFVFEDKNLIKFLSFSNAIH